MVPTSLGPPLSRAEMVSRDRGSVESKWAFFKDKIRRDAMIGMRMAFALGEVS